MMVLEIWILHVNLVQSIDLSFRQTILQYIEWHCMGIIVCSSMEINLKEPVSGCEEIGSANNPCNFV